MSEKGELWCYLGMPGYDRVTMAAARGFWRASRRNELAVRWDYREGSLLANGFNQLWVGALNVAHSGRPVRYFSMQHADIEPEDWWLDSLVAELEAKELDVLGVVAPIKDKRGMTSIALAHESGDPFRVHSRLTMREVFRLPETFTSEDVGRPLLLNTGLWVCRFDLSWAQQLHFEVNDRICFDTKLNSYVAQCESEDWQFSRLLHECGLRVGCTRRVGLSHAGGMRFTNTFPWGGDGWDSAHLSASEVPDDGFRFPDDVAGWLTHTEGRALFELCRGKTVLEIGSYCGRSTCCIGQSAKSVVCVDPFDGRATGSGQNTFDAFTANLERFDLHRKVRAEVGTSADVLPAIPPASFDLVFIDGAHDRESVETDIRLSCSLLRPGGVLVFHDYRPHPGYHDGRDDPGVRDAVNDLLASGGALLSTHGTLAVVRPPAPVLSEV